jgi:S-formylglutathione hydrolase
MYDYITEELPTVLDGAFPVDIAQASIFGHSMGGHGALVIALRNPAHYQSVSAFAPIVAPSHCPWGQKALGRYLGEDREAWKNYDTCALIEAGALQLPLLVDQGNADEFLDTQLQIERLEAACEATAYEATIRLQPGYDHSYYFIASFIGSHIAFHARELEKSAALA